MMDLNGLSKAHSVVLAVKHCVVLSNEHITQNPQWPSRRRDIQSHESTQTDFSTSLALLFSQKTHRKVHKPRGKSIAPWPSCDGMLLDLG